METTVESIDVEDGEYAAAYDADGLRLELHVAVPTRRSGRGWWQAIELTAVTLRPLVPPVAHPEELRAVLKAGIARAGKTFNGPETELVSWAAAALGRKGTWNIFAKRR
ncbi:MAG: hypothetical protein ABR567_14435 [Myxococcales bacterium]